MDTCKHNFLISISCKPFHFIYYITGSTASYSPSCIWNDTIRTELVTSVLYLYIRSCVFRYLIYLKFFISCFFVINIKYIIITAVVLIILIKYINNINLYIIAKNNIHRIILLNAVLIRLNITAGSYNYSFRIHFLCLMKHLA